MNDGLDPALTIGKVYDVQSWDEENKVLDIKNDIGRVHEFLWDKEEDGFDAREYFVEHQVLYSASWCQPCKVAKQYIEVNDIDVVIRDIDDNLAQFKSTGFKNVPVLIDSEGNPHHGAKGVMECLKRMV